MAKGEVGKKQRAPLRASGTSSSASMKEEMGKKEKKRQSQDESTSSGGKKAKKANKEDNNTPAIPRELNGNEYFQAVQELHNSSKHWHDLLDEDFAEGERATAWDDMLSHSQTLCEKYAWAIPDERALRILSNFGPLIEIGAGKGYWTRLLKEKGVDILAFDKYPCTGADKHLAWSAVKKGGPETLSQPIAQGRTLLLCYPDEQESMAAQCLENYSGEIILHVGEMIFTGTAMGAPVAPFGRTSSADFQVSLAENFHCLLMAKLSETYPLSKDCISVWKRTKLVSGRDHQSLVADETNQAPVNNKKSGKEDEEGAGKKKKAKKTEDKKAASSSSDSGGVEFISISDLNALREAALDMQYNEENESKWASIPEDEQLPIDRAAPCLQHLL